LILPQALPEETRRAMLNAVNLTRSFGNRQVLRGLSLTVEPAEIVSLVGINGAGKTTLLRVLANLLRPEQGMVRFGSYTPLNAPAEYRRHIGVVMHTSMLYDNLSARENLRFFSRLYQIADSDKRIRQVLEMVALNSRADELVRTFSRGMQQRLAIARALLHDPDLQGTDLLVKGERREEGVGLVEAPRGTLFHHYRVNKDDQVVMANLIVSTTNNNEPMNRAVQKVAQDHISGKPEITEGLLNHVEVAIRAYDPCLSCATHALGKMPLMVELIDCEGNVLDRKSRG